MPEVVREGTGYVMLAPEAGTQISVERIARSRGDLVAHVSITCSLPGTKSRTGNIHAARLNLSSSSSRATLVRVLRERANIPGLDWADLIEDLCRGVVAAEMAGEPVILVGALPRVAGGVTYRINPLVPLGMPAILYGEGGAGKSTLAAAFAVSCETGEPVVPGFTPNGRCRTLYLDWEGDRDQINERVAGVACGANVSRRPVMIRYQPMGGPLADHADTLAGYVSREGIGLVIVDSIGMASGAGSEGGDASESALRLFAAFRSLRTTVLALDHVSKASADEPTKQARPYGSIYKQNLARATWELRRAGDSLALYHTKSNVSRLEAPRGLSIEYGGFGEITYTQTEIPADGKLGGALSVKDRMWRILMEAGHMTPAELVDAVGSSRSTVSAELSRNPDLFGRLGSGKWEAIPNPVSRTAQGAS